MSIFVNVLFGIISVTIIIIIIINTITIFIIITIIILLLIVIYHCCFARLRCNAQIEALQLEHKTKVSHIVLWRIVRVNQ